MTRSSSRFSAAQGDSLASPTLKEAMVLEKLRLGFPIEQPACVVTAHPDDETICMGGRLAEFLHLTLIQITDGTPESMFDVLRAGLRDADQYRLVREIELTEALDRLGVAARRVQLGIRDQTAASHLAAIARILENLLRGAEVVITHPYEAGHPDHDSAAFGVQCACRMLELSGWSAPARLEFACYRKQSGRRVTGVFDGDHGGPGVEARLSHERLARKQAALACFRSQTDVIAWFSPACERYRSAPCYDFAVAPGPALYDDWGWGLSGASWCTLAAAALDELGLADAP